MKSFLREPLVHFLLIGAAIFLLFEVANDPTGPQSSRITVTNGQVDFLKARFAKTWQRGPTEKELQALINGHIREEILYREALALGLDKDDSVVRRRMTQKLELMGDDIAGITVPTDEDLQKYMEENPENFRIEPRLAFRQVYIDVAKRGIPADEEAQRLLAVLSDTKNRPDPDTLGDRLMIPGKVSLSPVSEIAKSFGEKFSLELNQSKVGQWTGPIQSGYGLHLVIVTDKIEGRLPELDEVRDIVEWEWNAAHKKRIRESIYKELREKYTIEFEEPANGAKVTQAVTVAKADLEEKQ